MPRVGFKLMTPGLSGRQRFMAYTTRGHYGGIVASAWSSCGERRTDSLWDEVRTRDLQNRKDVSRRPDHDVEHNGT